MRMTFRLRLLILVGATGLAFLLLLIASQRISNRVDAQLRDIQDRYVPRVELGPQLDSAFEALRRGFQDAVSARDTETLEQTRALKNSFFDKLDMFKKSVDPADVEALRLATEDYYAAAYSVSQRLIKNEGGEGMVDAIAAMQSKQLRASALLRKVTTFERRDLTEAFAAANRAQTTASRIRLALSAACLLFVFLLSFAMSRSILRSLYELKLGLARFEKGEFGAPIVVSTRDELGEVAEHANRMARSLNKLNRERERIDWLKNGQVGLARELRGELDPDEVARRALQFVASYIGAHAGVLYKRSRDDVLRPLAQHAMVDVPSSFLPGEGLIGQAAMQSHITFVHDPPTDYMRLRSGLGETSPKVIALLPLLHSGTATGVLEVALLHPWSESLSELLLAAGESIAIALEVASARALMRDLLLKAQQQAERLAAQEEELRSTNEELQAQGEELRQTNEELVAQTKELDEQRQILQQKNVALEAAQTALESKAKELAAVSAYKSQFLANMSHELRTPLNSMLLLSNLLAENAQHNLSDKQIEFAKTIHAAGNDLLALINQVLDLAKVEAGKQKTRLEPLRLSAIVQHVQRNFAPMARDKGLNFVVELDTSLPPTITTDAQRLTQVLNNLIANALKFTEKGEVSFRIVKPASDVQFARDDLDPDSTVAFIVSDTGIGVAQENQDRIFAPFEQVEAASDRRFGGTGLGLSIAKEFAALLKGEVRLESEPGKGSVFTFFVPLGEAVPPKQPVEDAIEDDRDAISPGDSFLLLIEDDHVFATACRDIVRAQGHKVIVAKNGSGGLAIAKERDPAGIILDVRLPDLDGFKVMEALRADKSTQNIPVHFISAVNAKERAMAMGAAGYLTKPVSQYEVMDVVRTLTMSENPRKILIASNAPSEGQGLVKKLENEHIDVRHVTSADDVIRALHSDIFSCVILDESLEDTDTPKLLETLQEAGGENMPPIIVYTARTLNREEAKKLEAAAEAVILKEGASEDRLLDEVKLFLRRLQEGLGPKRYGTPRIHPANVDLLGRRVLVVDDDMRTVYALSATLRAKGAEVLVADSGHAALSTLREHQEVEAVLMDIMMPEMDGYEAMRRIRSDCRYKDLPIIALTAKAMKGDREKCIQAGATEYLPKPIDAERLLSMLQSHLHRRVQDGA